MPVNGDTLDEANESYFVNLSNPSNAAVTDGQGLGTITDDDAMPALVIDDVTVTEGDTGTTTANFTVSLSSPSGQTVTVQFATANGTAIAPGDYTARTRTRVTFTAGQLTRTITVAVNGDTIDEVNETYFVNLSNATNATIADSQGVGTIIDDDGLPDALDQRRHGHRGPERHGERELHGHAVGAERPDGQRRLGDRRRHGDLAGATTRRRRQRSSSTRASTTRTITVPVNSDTLDELDETFTVTLSDPSQRHDR